MNLKISGLVICILTFTACNISTAYQGEKIKVYFSASATEAENEYCSKTVEKERYISPSKSTEEKAQLALAELIKGPTTEEITDGTNAFWIDSAAMILDSKLENGIFYVNWVNLGYVIPNANSSCGSQSFFAPLEKTLTQFPEIKSVRHAIKGDPQIFYEWMQIGCPADETQIPGSYCDPLPFKDMASL